MLSFGVLALLCSIIHRATAWTIRPSQRAHDRSISQHRSPARRPALDGLGNGWEPLSYASCTSNYLSSTALVAAGSSPSMEETGGYTVEDAGRCSVEALPALHNRYYALRHGQSVANMEGIISSDPKVGSVRHGLTSNGRKQSRVAATALIEAVGRNRLDSLVFVSSDFLRARQTAQECRAALENILFFEREGSTADTDGEGALMPAENDGAGAQGSGEEFSLDDGEVGGYDVSPPIVIRHELRERSFGELDGTILVNYNKVWPEDLKDGSHEGYGVESVCAVASRIRRLVRSLEREYEDADIVFTSHADTLQIAQCYIAGHDERLFSQYRFKNGEIRRLLQDLASLPRPAPLSFQ